MQKPKGTSAESDTGRGESCQYLGLEGDPASFCWEPSRQHRCYLWMQCSRIDLAHQERFCLTDSHVICPWFSINAPSSTQVDSALLRLWQAMRSVAARTARRAVAAASALWIWLRAVLWIRLCSAAGRGLRFLRSQGQRLLVGLGHFIFSLGVQARDLLAHMMRAWASTWRGSLSPQAVSSEHVPSAESVDPPAETAASPEPVEPIAAQEAPPKTSAAGELVERGILALREGSREVAYTLFVQASQFDPDSEDSWLWRAALSRSAEEKRKCLEQLLSVNPESSLARSALAQLEQPSQAAYPAAELPSRVAETTVVAGGAPDPLGPKPPDRSAVQKDPITWQCDACETINTGFLQVCRTCGHPSPLVEKELMSGGDKLLAEGLAGLKAGNEELAYGYFVKACKASPNNELAWYWRAKTSPTPDEVIRCLEQLLKINPGNAKAQADLTWALKRRELDQAQRKQTRSTSPTGRPTIPARPRMEVVLLRRVTGEVRWWLHQISALFAFATSLALTIPYVLLAGPPDRPELGKYLVMLPTVRLPELMVSLPDIPAFDVGPALPFFLGLLLLHAAFRVARGGGLGARIWMALLAAVAGWLMLSFGTNPPSPSYAAGLAAATVVGALAGGAPAEMPKWTS